jgi:hypothetical protein
MKKKPVDPRVQAFIKMWDEKYKEVHKYSYQFSGGQEGTMIKRTFAWLDKNVGSHISFTKFTKTAEYYIKVDDPFTKKIGYKISNLCSNFAFWMDRADKETPKPKPQPVPEVMKEKEEPAKFVLLSDDEIRRRFEEKRESWLKWLISTGASRSKLPFLQRMWAIMEDISTEDEVMAAIVRREEEKKNPMKLDFQL